MHVKKTRHSSFVSEKLFLICCLLEGQRLAEAEIKEGRMKKGPAEIKEVHQGFTGGMSRAQLQLQQKRAGIPERTDLAEYT